MKIKAGWQGLDDRLHNPHLATPSGYELNVAAFPLPRLRPQLSIAINDIGGRQGFKTRIVD